MGFIPVEWQQNPSEYVPDMRANTYNPETFKIDIFIYILFSITSKLKELSETEVHVKLKNSDIF